MLRQLKKSIELAETLVVTRVVKFFADYLLTAKVARYDGASNLLSGRFQ